MTREERNAWRREVYKHRTPEQIVRQDATKKRAASKANLARYGLTEVGYQALLANQGGHCALCPRTEANQQHHRLCVDHDHQSGTVRGLLCTPCNRALGVLGDNSEALQRAVRYLSKGIL